MISEFLEQIATFENTSSIITKYYAEGNPLEVEEAEKDDNYLEFAMAMVDHHIIQFVKNIDEEISRLEVRQDRKLKLEHILSILQYYNSQLLKVKGEIGAYIQMRIAVLLIDIPNKYSYLTNYTEEKSKNKPAEKIKWLENINLLATFFYDLKNGQEKGHGIKKTKTKPYIDAQINTIVQLIVDNFEKPNGEKFSAANLINILSTSKSKEKDKVHFPNRFEFPE